MYLQIYFINDKTQLNTAAHRKYSAYDSIMVLHTQVIENNRKLGAEQLKPAILATWEAGIGRIPV
jgi:hypothetical protein